MIKKTVYISNPLSLSQKNEQLVLTDKATGLTRTIPLEDIGIIVIDCQQTVYTHYLIQSLSEHNITVVFCDKNHYPASSLYHFNYHSTQSQTFGWQANAAEPLKKNLWKQIVAAKIKNQALLLKKLNKNYQDVLEISKDVKSGDSTNREGFASKRYWSRLFDMRDFKRERFGDPPNNLLNYIYAVLRAMTARALTGSGLLPTLGIFHKNKYNDFCLADDIMEPYRPFADELIIEWISKNNDIFVLGKEFKAHALTIPVVDVYFKKVVRPLMIGLTFSSASLAKCYSKKAKNLHFPEIK